MADRRTRARVTLRFERRDPPPVDGLTEGLPDDRTPSPEDALFCESQSSMILDLLHDLDERESKILRLRYGLDGDEPLTLKEIGAAINLTRERVRQIECEALRKLEAYLRD